MADRIHDGLSWLSGEFSATPDEFRRAMRPDGAMLLEAIHSHGYVIHDKRQDRYAVSVAGRRRMADVEPAEVETD